MFMTSTSTSPSLSMSPNAAPRLECGAVAPAPLCAVTSSNRARRRVAEDDARAAVRVLRQHALDLRIDVAGDVEHVRPAVVVEIGQAGAPLDVAVLHARGRPRRDVLEQALAEIAVERGDVVGEVRLEQVEPAVAVDSRRPPRPCRPADCRARCRPRRSRRATSVNVPSRLLRYRIAAVESEAT